MARPLLLPMLLVVACSVPPPGQVRIVGHGGAGAGSPYPMNSRAAVLRGLELGADGVELDVQLTRDSVLVAYHAEDLAELTACTGAINAHSWAELAPCTVPGSTGPAPIARLDSLLPQALAHYPAAHFTLDCKLFAAGDWWPYLETFSQAVAELGAHPALAGRLTVECQVVPLLALVQRKAPALPVYLYATAAQAGIDTAAAHGFAGITMDHALMDAAQVAEAHRRGLRVSLFGVGSTLGHREALAKEPDALQTDAPEDFAPR